MYWRTHAKCPLSLSDLNKNWEFPRQIFVQVPNINFRGNPSSVSCAGISGQKDGRTGMTTLIGAFPDYARTSNKNVQNCVSVAAINILFRTWSIFCVSRKPVACNGHFWLLLYYSKCRKCRYSCGSRFRVWLFPWFCSVPYPIHIRYIYFSYCFLHFISAALNPAS